MLSMLKVNAEGHENQPENEFHVSSSKTFSEIHRQWGTPPHTLRRLHSCALGAWPPPSTQIQILNPLVTASCLQLLSLNTGELN